MESLISTFHIDWKIIIAQMINFGIVFAVLYVYALKPLSKLMKEREDKIVKGLEDAKSNANILGKTEKEYADALTKARNEANIIFQDGKKEAEVKKSQMLEEARTEVTRMIENGKKTLEAEKSKMVQDAKKEIVSVAMLATEKLVGSLAHKSIDEKVVKELSDL